MKASITYLIVFYVPKNACEQVKQAMFTEGAGALGNYDQCCWQVLGQGQFCALSGSVPAIGDQNSLTQLDEYRVEMLCNSDCLHRVIQAMKEVHPYEEVAFHVVQNETL